MWLLLVLLLLLLLLFKVFGTQFRQQVDQQMLNVTGTDTWDRLSVETDFDVMWHGGFWCEWSVKATIAARLDGAWNGAVVDSDLKVTLTGMYSVHCTTVSRLTIKGKGKSLALIHRRKPHTCSCISAVRHRQAPAFSLYRPQPKPAHTDSGLYRYIMQPQSAVKLFPPRYPCNCMDYNSRSDPGCTVGWVGLVGWPIADILSRKWSSVNHRSVKESLPAKDRRSNHECPTL